MSPVGAMVSLMRGEHRSYQETRPVFEGGTAR